MVQVFLSYARDDDEVFVKKVYEHLTAQGVTVWWDRVSMPSRALTFMQEIRDAIHDAERLLLIVGPRALSSGYVRAEWQHALADNKVVIPVLRLGGYDDFPAELQHVHGPSCLKERALEESLAEITRVLRDPIPPLGMIAGNLPDLPPHFQPRTAEMTRLAEEVFRGITDPAVVTGRLRAVLLHGMGGIGKSVLAAAFARAVTTRRVFRDGVIWLSARPEARAGRKTSRKTRPLVLMNELGSVLSGAPQTYHDSAEAQTKVTPLLQGRTVLLVLDNIWNVDQLEPIFGSLDTHTRVLMTSRQSDLGDGIRGIPISELSEQSALEHLADWLDTRPDELPGEARELAKECGYLPFAIALNGAMLAKGQSWSNLLGALRDADLQYADKRFLNYPYPSLLRSIQVSIDALNSEDAEILSRYRELAAFEWTAPVTESAIATLWKRSGRVPERSVRKILLSLHDRSLLRLNLNAAAPSITLHDLMVDYLRDEEAQPALNDLLIDAYRQRCEADWPSGPADGYFHKHLVLHLARADRPEEIHRLLALEENGSNAWYRAGEAIGNTDGFLKDLDFALDLARSDTGHDRIALEFRYAAMAASVRSIAGTVPPALLARVVKAGLWSAQRALIEANQAPDPGQRVDALIALSPYLPDDDKRHALAGAVRYARSISNATDRAQALACLVPYHEGPERKTIVDEALATAHSIGDAYFAPAALLAVLPHISGRERQFAISQALEAVRVTGPLVQVGYLPRLVPYLESPERENALNATLNAAFALSGSSRSNAFASLVPYGSGTQKEQLVAEALMAAKSEPDPGYRIDAMTRLIPHVSADVLAQMHSDAPAIANPEVRARVLIALLPAVDDAMDRGQVVRNALEAAATISLEAARSRSLAIVAPYLSDELVPRALSVAREIRDDAARLRALIDSLAHLNGGEKKAALSTAVTSARLLADPNRKAAALAAIAPHVEGAERYDALAEALAALDTLDPFNQSLGLESLAGYLQERLTDTALSCALAIPDANYRARALAALAPRLSEQQIDALLDKTRDGRIADGASLVVAIVTRLEGDQLSRAVAEALTAARSIDEPQTRANLLIALMPHVRQDIDLVVSDALQATLAIADPRERANALGSLAPYLSGADLDTALETAWQMPDPHSRAHALARLLIRFTGEEREVAVARALDAASTVDNGFARASVLAALVPVITSEAAKHDVLNEALSAVRADPSAPWRSGALKALAPHLGGEPLAEALNIAASLDDLPSRARSLVTLSRSLSDERVLRLVDEELDAFSGLDSQKAVVEFMPLVLRAISAAPREAGYRLWKKTLALLSLGDRPQFLAAAGPMLSIVARLGRDGAVKDCADAIQVAGRWWR